MRSFVNRNFFMPINSWFSQVSEAKNVFPDSSDRYVSPDSKSVTLDKVDPESLNQADEQKRMSKTRLKLGDSIRSHE